MSEMLNMPPSRGKMAALGGVAQSWISRVGQKMTRENMVQGVKTLAWVVPLTLLIWIYAEREQVATLRDISIPVDIRSPEADRVVTLQKQDRNIVLELSGPRAAIDRVRSMLPPNADMSALPVLIDRGLAPGQSYSIGTARQLSRNELFADHGVTVTSASPTRLNVFVDQVVERELEVSTPPGLTWLVGQPTYDPPRVVVRGPASVIEQAQNLAAIADLSGQNLREGEYTLPAVRIRPLADKGLELRPATVRATFLVREMDERLTIPSMPLWIVAAPGLADAFRFETNPPFVANVTVIGPHDKIELLKTDAFKPTAEIRITRDDFQPNTPRQMQITRFNLPEGVRVSTEDEKRVVELRATPRGGGE